MNKNKLAELGIFKDRQDGTLKNVYKSIDSNEIIEMTLVPNKENTDVFCVPTHHFCSLGCKINEWFQFNMKILSKLLQKQFS